jgi:hypothetical protein
VAADGPGYRSFRTRAGTGRAGLAERAAAAGPVAMGAAVVLYGGSRFVKVDRELGAAGPAAARGCATPPVILSLAVAPIIACCSACRPKRSVAASLASRRPADGPRHRVAPAGVTRPSPGAGCSSKDGEPLSSPGAEGDPLSQAASAPARLDAEDPQEAQRPWKLAPHGLSPARGTRRGPPYHTANAKDRRLHVPIDSILSGPKPGQRPLEPNADARPPPAARRPVPCRHTSPRHPRFGPGLPRRPRGPGEPQPPLRTAPYAPGGRAGRDGSTPATR